MTNDPNAAPTPLTDSFLTKKVWVEWTHKGGELDGAVDGGYRFVPRDDLTIEEVLYFARDLEHKLAEVSNLLREGLNITENRTARELGANLKLTQWEEKARAALAGGDR